ncbi:hypothetical protein ISS08_00010 [Candidatus Pacearchaeota archaeon]|nr:hypothetical protein [Candidatus Pacearchaeota archaeon]
MNLFTFTIGVVLGLIIFEIFSGEKEGRIGLFILLLKTKHHSYHLHHWMISLIILLLLIITNWKNYFVYGFLIGSIIQGLKYHDFYKILVKQKRKKRVKKTLKKY